MPGRTRGGSPSANARYRRSAPLVVYWKHAELIFENFALQAAVSAEPLVCSILNYCHEWRSVSSVCSHLRVTNRRSVQRVLEQLRANALLEKYGEKQDPRLEAMKEWSTWNPAAGFFHFSTKDTEFAHDQAKAFSEWTARGTTQMPVPSKGYPKTPKIKLPRLKSDGEFPAVLRGRRTWRKYGRGAVSLQCLSQILEMTFGIQAWVNIPGVGRAAMKTSPSGGALHPIEAYVLVQNVHGLEPGFYHYNSARHELERLRKPVPRPVLERNLGNQWWFSHSAFLVAMTAVSHRTRWKYEYPRAYRALLLEAGHLGQTFCLTATWLGLAPFSTIAITDTKWEEWLGIDGVRESVLYVVGAGTRPDGAKDAHLGLLGKVTRPK